MIKIRFISNYFNHHQKPLCDAFVKNEVDFKFYTLGTIPEERLKLGYKQITADYVYPYDESPEIVQDFLTSDVVIFTYKPQQLFKKCLDEGILTFVYTERLFKKGRWRGLSPHVFFNYRKQYLENKSLPYILCAGAYVKGDCCFWGFPADHCLKWGYFPSIEALDIPRYDYSVLRILWVGRYIDWKHPELVVEVSRRLKDMGIIHHVDMIGTGPLLGRIRQLVIQKEVEDTISVHGSMPPDEVQQCMKKNHILFVTSDKQEGWGAVVNEGMSCGCVVVACEDEGSVPYLIKNGMNGYSYRYRDVNNIVNILENLSKNPDLINIISKNAAKTIEELWNADVAAERLLGFIKDHKLAAEGPISLA